MITLFTESELLQQLQNNNFESYGLKIGFREFSRRYTEGIGSSWFDNPKWEKFEWLSRNKQPVNIEIAVIGGNSEEYYMIRW
jgi:hypothetical protein